VVYRRGERVQVLGGASVRRLAKRQGVVEYVTSTRICTQLKMSFEIKFSGVPGPRTPEEEVERPYVYDVPFIIAMHNNDEENKAYRYLLDSIENHVFKTFPYNDIVQFRENKMGDFAQRVFDKTHALFNTFEYEQILHLHELAFRYESNMLFRKTYHLYTMFDKNLIIRFFDCGMLSAACALLQNTIQYLDVTNIDEIISISELFRSKPTGRQYERDFNLFETFLQSLYDICITKKRKDVIADDGKYADYIRSITNGKTIKKVLDDFKNTKV
jgi:hypothetical protein